MYDFCFVLQCIYVFLTFWSFNLYVIILFSFCEAKILGGIHTQIRSYVIAGAGKAAVFVSDPGAWSPQSKQVGRQAGVGWGWGWGVHWEEQGQCAATITELSPWEDGVIPAPVHIASTLGGMVWLSAFGHEAKHTSGSGVRAAKGGYKGRLSTACLATHFTQRWNWISDHVYKLQNDCCFTATLQVSWKNLSCPLLWEIERKVDTLQNYHTPIFFSSDKWYLCKF